MIVNDSEEENEKESSSLGEMAKEDAIPEKDYKKFKQSYINRQTFIQKTHFRTRKTKLIYFKQKETVCELSSSFPYLGCWCCKFRVT